MIGVTVTTVFALADAFWPALTVLAGALAASGLLLARSGGQKRYVLTGVVYCLGLAIVLEFIGAGLISRSYMRIVLPAVGGLGAISAVLVVAKVAGKRVVKHLAAIFVLDEEYLGQLWETLAALGSLLMLLWLLITFAEKVLRYASVSVGAVALLVANMLGYEVMVFIFGVRVEAIMALFVGCVLIWFHLLDTLHNSWKTVAQSAEKADEFSESRTEEEPVAQTEAKR